MLIYSGKSAQPSLLVASVEPFLKLRTHGCIAARFVNFHTFSFWALNYLIFISDFSDGIDTIESMLPRQLCSPAHLWRVQTGKQQEQEILWLASLCILLFIYLFISYRLTAEISTRSRVSEVESPQLDVPQRCWFWILLARLCEKLENISWHHAEAVKCLAQL